jgi:hypothetical protein
MFNFLKNKEQKPEENQDVVASISYNIGNDNTVEVDVHLEDYDAHSISQLCKILDILSQDIVYMNTLEIIKEGLQKDNAQEALDQIYKHLSLQISDKIVNSIK